MADRSLSLLERANKALAYDPETGKFHWLARPDRSPQWNGRYAGTEAGSLIASTGYLSIRLDSKAYQAHHLAWLIVHGNLPPVSIDHINRDKTDNRIANLRLATLAENNLNAPIRSNNTSGFKGVSLHRATGKWMAMIAVGGRSTYLGLFASKQEAADAYAAAGRRLHGEFFSSGR